MKNGKNLFVVTYEDKNNVRHMAFVNHFTSIKQLENQYGQRITINTYIFNDLHVLKNKGLQESHIFM